VTARVAIEQASTLGWDRYVSANGKVVGMRTLGASALLKELQKKFGFEPEHIMRVAKNCSTDMTETAGRQLAPGKTGRRYLRQRGDEVGRLGTRATGIAQMA